MMGPLGRALIENFQALSSLGADQQAAMVNAHDEMISDIPQLQSYIKGGLMTTKQIYPPVTEVKVTLASLREAVNRADEKAIAPGNPALDEMTREIIAQRIWAELGGSA